MKKKLSLFLIVFVISVCSCNRIEPVDKNNNKPESEYFSFKTSKNVVLDINYGYSEYFFPFGVYIENPYNSEGKLKKDIKPIYSAYTDKNSSYKASLQIPSYVNRLYVHTNAYGVPKFLTLDITDGKATYNASINSASSSILTRSYTALPHINIGGYVHVVNYSYDLSALCSDMHEEYWRPTNSYVPGLYSIIENYDQINGHSIGGLINRLCHMLSTPYYDSDGVFLGKPDNSQYVVDADHINLTIKKPANIEHFKGAQVDVTTLCANGGYNNAMGYYYYKTGTNPDIRDIPKFLIFPRTGRYIYERQTRIAACAPVEENHDKVRLQFFGENYEDQGIDEFPEGYTIGWILFSNISNNSIYDDDISLYNFSSYNDVLQRIVSAYSYNYVVYSNPSANQYGNAGCIALYDTETKTTVYGFEEMAFGGNDYFYNDHSYEDLLFYVDVNPIEAVQNPNIPIIEPNDPSDIVTHTVGTLAFEDIWPSGGDYDMNDVVIEYDTEVTSDAENNIKKIVDIFKFVHDGASIHSAFGYQIEGKVGTIDYDNSDIAVVEEDNQLIICRDSKESFNKTLKVTRKNLNLKKQDYQRSYNPFIVLNYDKNRTKGVAGRKEVHLPHNSATSWADSEILLTGNDAYYVDKDGKYPFAIDLFNITNWQVVTEKSKIGSVNEYPLFESWANSHGTKDTDWYLWKDGVRINHGE